MKNFILLRIADNIRNMRIQRGLSQSDLAASAGVNRKTIIELEKGAAGVALGTAVAVLESMGGELTVVHVSKPTTQEVQSLLGIRPPHWVYAHPASNPALEADSRALRGLRRIRVAARDTIRPEKPVADP